MQPYEQMHRLPLRRKTGWCTGFRAAFSPPPPNTHTYTTDPFKQLGLTISAWKHGGLESREKGAQPLFEGLAGPLVALLLAGKLPAMHNAHNTTQYTHEATPKPAKRNMSTRLSASSNTNTSGQTKKKQGGGAC